MHHHLTTWFLVLLMILQMVLADQHDAKDCLVYCLKCDGNSVPYQTPNVTMQGPLEVSLQVAADGKLPKAHIVLRDSKPRTEMQISEGKVKLLGDKVSKTLTLTSTQPAALSWISLVLDPAGQDTLLVYTPTDRVNVITANTTHNSILFVSSNAETHVAFNCLSGCLIRNTSSALVGGEVPLHPPFTMYLNPRHGQHFINPVLTLTSSSGANKTVIANGSEWTQDTWHRVKVQVGKEQQVVKPKLGRDGVMEALILVANDTYTITQLKGFSWTLHCIPEELLDTLASSVSPDPENTTENVFSSTLVPETDKKGGEGENKKSKQKAETGGAGAGQVAAWVMAALALFLVMVLALALCTKTARPGPGPTQHVHDNQPSVGIIYWKGATREPDEDSEPESPNELKVPSFRDSPLKQPVPNCKALED